jgi:hypothetical protein
MFLPDHWFGSIRKDCCWSSPAQSLSRLVRSLYISVLFGTLARSLVWVEIKNNISIILKFSSAVLSNIYKLYYISSPLRLLGFVPEIFCSMKLILSHSLTHGAEPFLRSCQSCSYSRTSQHFMEPGGSPPRSHKPSTGPYPDPDRSNPYHPILPL